MSVRRIFLIALVPGCSLLTGLDALQSDAGADASFDTGSDVHDDAADAQSSCSPDAIFCDDFENEPAGFVPRWDEVQSILPDKIEVSTAQSHGGTHSLDVASSGSAANPLFLVLHAKLGNAFAVGATFGLRAWVFAPGVEQSSAWFSLESSATLGNVTLTHNADTACPDGGRCFVAFRALNAPDWIMGSFVDIESTPSTWTCLEWVVTVATAGPELVYVNNGTAISTTYDAVLDGLTGFDTLKVGYQAPTVAQELYIDDLVIMNKRVGCN